MASLDAPVDAFVEEVNAGLAAAAAATGSEVAADDRRTDVVTEAFNIVAAVLMADGRQTDDELSELVAAFGPRLGGVLATSTATDLRDSEVLATAQGFEARPSALLEILVAHDDRTGSATAGAYYRRGLALAHAAAGLDRHTSTAEVTAVGRLRDTLLALVPRDVAVGRARPGGADGGGTAATGPGDDTDAAADVPEAEDLEGVLAELDELIGLEAVKAEVRLIADMTTVQALRAERGLPTMAAVRHLVFTGNPGTGKTTVARLLARVFRALRVLDRGHLVEVGRAQLVAGYVGQTATRVTEVFDRATGGLLVIDEAYALARGGEKDFGREAIDTLVKLVEDRRDEVVVVVAGYPDEMTAFLDLNPGMRSRFPRTIHFPDYTDDELVAIFTLVAQANGYAAPPDVLDTVRRWFAAQPRARGFGNGRLARTLFEDSAARHASRVADRAEPSDRELTTLEAADVPAPTPAAVGSEPGS